MKMKIEKILLIFSMIISYLIFINAISLAAGDSDDEDTYRRIQDTYYLNGKEQAYNGNYESAIKYLEKSIKNDPTNANAFNMLGYSNRKLGKNKEAFGYYNKALKLDPKHRGTHEYLGKLYLNLNQPEKAKIHLSKLDDICLFGCDEYTSLKKAIEGYDKNKLEKNY